MDRGYFYEKLSINQNLDLVLDDCMFNQKYCTFFLFSLPSSFPRHSANINLHRKLLTKELDDMGLDTSQPSLSKDLRDEFLVKIYGAQHQMGLDIREDTSSPAGTEDSHMNGYGRGMAEDYMVLDLSTTSSIQSSSSIHSSRESDAGSDEGILLDDVDGQVTAGNLPTKQMPLP